MLIHVADVLRGSATPGRGRGFAGGPFAVRALGSYSAGARRNPACSSSNSASAVVAIPRDPVPGGRQREHAGLERGVVRDTKPGIGAQAADGAIGEVSLDDAQQILHLPWAHGVACQPSVLEPVLQAHGRPR